MSLTKIDMEDELRDRDQKAQDKHNFEVQVVGWFIIGFIVLVAVLVYTLA